MSISLAEFTNKYSFECSIKSTFGIECPGCGFQRALVLLFNGNLFESIQQYPALIPIMLLWILLLAHLVFKFRHGAKYLQYLFIFCTLIIYTSYIYKII
jgi:hypothetical protein